MKKNQIQMFFITISVITLILISFFILKKSSSTKSIFSGTDIVFFCGGNTNGSVARVIYNGAKAAEKEFDLNIKYVWSGWDKKVMADQFKDAIYTKPDGICVFGLPGKTVFTPLVDEAIEEGVLVTFLGMDIPSIREKYTYAGVGYVGLNSINAAQRLARVAVKKNKIKAGSVAIVLGIAFPVSGLIKKMPNTDAVLHRSLRGLNIVKGLLEKNLEVYAFSIPLEVDSAPDSEVAYLFIKNLLKKYPQTKMIAVDHGGLTGATPNILKKLNYKPNEIIAVGFDLSKKTVEGIENGYLNMISDQQPFLEGYLSVLQICLSKKYQFTGLYIDSGSSLIDRSNIDKIKGLALKEIR